LSGKDLGRLLPKAESEWNDFEAKLKAGQRDEAFAASKHYDLPYTLYRISDRLRNTAPKASEAWAQRGDVAAAFFVDVITKAGGKLPEQVNVSSGVRRYFERTGDVSAMKSVILQANEGDFGVKAGKSNIQMLRTPNQTQAASTRLSGLLNLAAVREKAAEKGIPSPDLDAAKDTGRSRPRLSWLTPAEQAWARTLAGLLKGHVTQWTKRGSSSHGIDPLHATAFTGRELNSWRDAAGDMDVTSKLNRLGRYLISPKTGVWDSRNGTFVSSKTSISDTSLQQAGLFFKLARLSENRREEAVFLNVAKSLMKAGLRADAKNVMPNLGGVLGFELEITGEFAPASPGGSR